MSVTLKTTHGDLKIELFAETHPRSAFNFLAHAAAGTYTGVIFHRSIHGFALQGGDPTGTGKGGEYIHGGYMADEFSDESIKHDRRGMVSWASSTKRTTATADLDTIGSQFFITYEAQPHLDNQFTVFGRLVGERSLKTLEIIEEVPVGDSKKHRPIQDIKIDEVVIHANPLSK